MSGKSSTYDTLVLTMADSAYLGDAEFTISVDGVQVGGIQTVDALYALGQTQNFTVTGDFGTGPHTVVVTFLNPYDGGTAATDRSLYFESLNLDGTAVAVDTIVGTTAVATVTAATQPTATDTVAVNVSEDAWQGNAQFLVLVDGVQVGGIQTATASHAAGQSQTITLTGNFGPGAHVVALDFINDASGGTAATDRNLYFNSVTYDGTTTVVNAALLSDGDSGGITVSDTATATAGAVVNAAATATATGMDTFVFEMAEDFYQSNAQFAVMIDGKVVANPLTVTASNAAGAEQQFTITGAYGTGRHFFGIYFLNHVAGPTATTGSNLYLISLTVNGVLQTGVSGELSKTGSTNFAIQEAPVAAPVTTDTLELFVSEDYYLTNAQFTVTVDGNAVGGVQTATASHALGEEQTITLYGAFGSGPHTVVVTFLNDAWGGSTALDRNLYVAAIDYDGVYTPVNAGLFSTGSASTTVVGASGTPATPVTSMSAQGTLQMVGVNLSGLEFGGAVYPGVLGTNYVEPTHAEIDYYASEGMNVIRLPFDWERLQPVMNGPLNQQYLALIDDVVHYAGTKGITVDLDMHNYGEYYGNLVGSAAVPNSAFANVWSQIAAHYASTSNVMFGLMNEPSQPTPQAWLTSDNAAIAAIRTAGAGQEILVPGTDASGGQWWFDSGNANVMDGIVDPKMNFAIDVHQYLDADNSGTSTSVVSPTIGVERLTAITEWAAATGNRLFLSEFGAGTDAASLTAMGNMLTYMAQNTNVWQGATEWGGGPWWSSSYGFATDPVNGVTKPQISLLKTYE